MITRHKVSNIDRNDINVNGMRLQYVNTCKHLGVLILWQTDVTWSDRQS